MTLLAAYYTLADIVLLAQCFWYKSRKGGGGGEGDGKEEEEAVDGDHLSPATPLLGAAEVEEVSPAPSWVAVAVNAAAVLSVCLAGALGWAVTSHYAPSTSPSPSPSPPSVPEFSPIGQTFGYLCAALYLSSRIPQILLNAKRRSCEGVSILFFVFACVGNATYVLSILANDQCGEDGYGRYVAVNASWLLGSVGTLLLDAIIFAQFFVYGDGEGKRKKEGGEVEA
jgi:hypothetical protein